MTAGAYAGWLLLALVFLVGAGLSASGIVNEGGRRPVAVVGLVLMSGGSLLWAVASLRAPSLQPHGPLVLAAAAVFALGVVVHAVGTTRKG